MILPNPKAVIHKVWLYRALTAICDDDLLSKSLAFKGGTCAAMLSWLDRFSVDLDFDFLNYGQVDIRQVRQRLEKIFKDLGLTIKDKSANVPQYFLRYPVKEINQRNTLKIDITDKAPASNEYKIYRLREIDRVINCQSKETMFANKLVALLERFENNGSIAGRDLYDIHYFFHNNYCYSVDVIQERTGKDPKDFLISLKDFIEKKITQRIIDQDINTLLPNDKFQAIRKSLKQEVIFHIDLDMKTFFSKKIKTKQN